MFLQASRTDGYTVLYSVVVSPEIADRVIPGNLDAAIDRLMRASGVEPIQTSGIRGSFRVNQSNIITSDRAEWDTLFKFRVRRDMDSTLVDDIYARAWNEVMAPHTIPTRNTSRPGELLSVCSQFQTRRESSIWGFMEPLIPWADVEFYQVCSQYAVGARDSAVGPASTADRLIASPIVSATDPALVGTNPSQSTDIQGLAGGAWNSAARTINSAVGASEGGMGVSDLKFFAYAGLGIVGVLVLVKVVKEVKAI